MTRFKIAAFLALIGWSLALHFFLTEKVEAQTLTKWWYSTAPHVVGVNPYTGELKAVWKGSAQVCSQPSKVVTTPTQCFTVTVTSVVK